MPVYPGNPYFASIDLKSEGRVGTPYAIDGHRDYERTFLAITRSQGVTEWQMKTAPGIPIPGSVYVAEGGNTFDLLAVLENIQCKQVGDEASWYLWNIICRFSTRVGQNGPQKDPDHPETDYPEIAWDFEEVQVPLQRDLYGRAIMTSNALPVDPPITYSVAVPVLSITRNELNFNVARARKYAYAANSDTFLGAKTGECLCLPPRAQQMWKGNSRYWRVSYKIKFSYLIPDPTWMAHEPPDCDKLKNGQVPQVPYRWDQYWLLDQGYYQLADNPLFNKQQPPSPTNKKYVQVPVFRWGQMVQHPVLLDGLGHEALPGPCEYEYPSQGGHTGIYPPQPYYIQEPFQIRNRQDFRSLLVQGLG
jgi:hypothetical protein